MHAPESPNTCWNRTLLGTLLDYWNLAGTLLQPCWKVAQILPQPCWSRARTLLEPCWSPASWNLAGKSLELCWNFSGSWCFEHGETLLEPCWNLWLEHFAGNQCGCRFRFSVYTLAFLNVPGCEVGSLAWTLLEPGCNLAIVGTYMRTTSGFSWGFSFVMAGNQRRRSLAETVMLESLPEPLNEPLLEPWHEPCSPGLQGCKVTGQSSKLAPGS